MALRIPDGLPAVVEGLRRLDTQGTQDGVSRHFLEIELSSDKSELRINGNPYGLIHFARTVLDVVGRGVEGGHHHFDETGMVDRCDLPVVVRLKAAEWDAD